jgi:hypothetical protein
MLRLRPDWGKGWRGLEHDPEKACPDVIRVGTGFRKRTDGRAK